MKNKIKKELINLADEEYKKFHSNLCPGTNNILGVRVPVLREYAKNLNKEYAIQELLVNIDNEYNEEIMLQGMVIGLNKNEDLNIILNYIKDFVPKINNWGVCDTFCAGLKITKKHKKEMWEFIKNYLKSDKEFELRFSIVMILDYYIDEEYLNKIFKIFESIKSKFYYVNMAISWAISICLIKYYDETMEYLQKANLSRKVYNKALQKAIESYRISDEQKIYLRNIKRID